MGSTLCAEEKTAETIYYRKLKLCGTKEQLEQMDALLAQLRIEHEELGSGIVNGLRELTTPDFDSFVAFDIEHTGTYGRANGDLQSEITEIGAVRVQKGRVVERFDMLCNPGRDITPMVERLTHITNEMVADQPPVTEAIRAFHAFAGDAILLGHSIEGCDIPHILRAADRAGITFENPYFDTKPLALRLKNRLGLANVKLSTLADFFAVRQTSAHRAWCDAEATAQVYLHLRACERKLSK